jgi:Domain of unknown function(DUF2779)
MIPPIPLYEGTRPYQTIPFQWPLHASGGDGVLHHREFLAEGEGDPRKLFTETLKPSMVRSSSIRPMKNQG